MAMPTSIRIPDTLMERITREIDSGSFNSVSDFMIYTARFYCDLKDLERTLDNPSGYGDLESWLQHCAQIYVDSQKKV